MCKSAPRSRQITTPVPHHSVFYRPDVRWLSKDYFARRCPRKHSKCWSQKIPPHHKCTSTLPCELWNCNAENYHQACTWTSKQSPNVKLPELKVYIDALITHNMTTVVILLMGCLQLELKESHILPVKCNNWHSVVMTVSAKNCTHWHWHSMWLLPSSVRTAGSSNNMSHNG